MTKNNWRNNGWNPSKFGKDINHRKGKETGIKQNKQKTNTTTELNPNRSIITLKANGLNVSIKRQRVTEWIKKKAIYKKLISNMVI